MTLTLFFFKSLLVLLLKIDEGTREVKSFSQTVVPINSMGIILKIITEGGRRGLS